MSTSEPSTPLDVRTLRAIHTRMLELETKGDDGRPMGQFIANILGIGHDDIFDRALALEHGRVDRMFNSHYADWMDRTPESFAWIGFLQGVTYAVAAQQVLAERETADTQ